jgi:hypothetical protein
VVVVAKGEDSIVAPCAIQYARLDLSRKTNAFTLSIVPANSSGAVPFQMSVSPRPDADWTDNILFCQIIEEVFSKMGEAYHNRK